MDSLLLYLSSFLISALTARVVQDKISSLKRLNFIVKILLSGFIMFPPIIVACCRYNIGIDYETYLSTFSLTHQISILDYYDTFGNFEFLNKPLVDLGYLIFGDVTGVFSIYAIFTIITYELSLLNYRKSVSLTVSTTILLLLLYAPALNIVRQSLSIAIVFYATKYIIERKCLHYCILILIASGIHSSSFIALLFYFLYNNHNTAKSKIIKLCIILSPLLVLTGLSFISEFSIFERYFLSYDETSTDISKSYILKLPVLLLILLSYKQLKRHKLSSLFIAIYAMEWTLLFTAGIYKWAFRLSYYSYIGQIILMSMTLKHRKISTPVHNFIAITWYLLYFYVLIYLWGRDGIFPYTIK